MAVVDAPLNPAVVVAERYSRMLTDVFRALPSDAERAAAINSQVERLQHVPLMTENETLEWWSSVKPHLVDVFNAERFSELVYYLFGVYAQVRDCRVLPKTRGTTRVNSRLQPHFQLAHTRYIDSNEWTRVKKPDMAVHVQHFSSQAYWPLSGVLGSWLSADGLIVLCRFYGSCLQLPIRYLSWILSRMDHSTISPDGVRTLMEQTCRLTTMDPTRPYVFPSIFYGYMAEFGNVLSVCLLGGDRVPILVAETCRSHVLVKHVLDICDRRIESYGGLDDPFHFEVGKATGLVPELLDILDQYLNHAIVLESEQDMLLTVVRPSKHIDYWLNLSTEETELYMNRYILAWNQLGVNQWDQRYRIALHWILEYYIDTSPHNLDPILWLVKRYEFLHSHLPQIKEIASWSNSWKVEELDTNGVHQMQDHE